MSKTKIMIKAYTDERELYLGLKSAIRGGNRIPFVGLKRLRDHELEAFEEICISEDMVLHLLENEKITIEGVRYSLISHSVEFNKDCEVKNIISVRKIIELGGEITVPVEKFNSINSYFTEQYTRVEHGLRLELQQAQNENYRLLKSLSASRLSDSQPKEEKTYGKREVITMMLASVVVTVIVTSMIIGCFS